MRMSDEDAAIEDWISSQAAVDNSIVENTLFRSEYSYFKNREFEGNVDTPPWEENLKEASVKTIFTLITLTSIVTLIIDPKMIVVTLPVSVLVALLLSMVRKSRKRHRRVGVIIPGEEIW
jgi:hypothetical protein